MLIFNMGSQSSRETLFCVGTYVVHIALHDTDTDHLRKCYSGNDEQRA